MMRARTAALALPFLAFGVAPEAGASSLAELPHSLEIWDNAARLALPTWLKAWLGLLALSFVASLAFVRRHPAARVVALGFLGSHVTVALLDGADLAVMRTGLVSLLHVVFWTPAAVALLRALPSAAPGSPFGIWSRLLLGIIAVAFVFDLRDAGMYLYYQASGHPALM